MHGLSTTTLIGLLVVVAIIGGLMFAFISNKEQQAMLSVSNFDECAAAGYPIMESYPEQCKTPDGRTFINESQMLPTSNDGLIIQANGCAVAGCSQTVCVSAEEAPNIVTTCEYRAEYACYREASCEPQADGKCGWTETAELTQCLANPPALDDAEPQAI